MRKYLVAFCLLGLTQFAWSDKLYVRNRPFTGVTLSDSGKLFVQLDVFCTALELKLQEREGTYYLGPLETLPGTTPSGTFWVSGQQVATRSENGVTLVALEDAAPALGLKVTPNRSMGTIDVFKVAPGTTASGSTAAPAFTSASYDPEAQGRAFFDADKDCWGLKDASGQVVVRPKFRNVDKFQHGLAGARLLEMKSVTLKSKGTEVTTTYETVSGVEAVKSRDVKDKTTYSMGKTKKETLFGVINTQGEWLIEPTYDRIKSVRRMGKVTYIEVQQGSSTFWVDPTGRRIRNPDDVYRDQLPPLKSKATMPR
jgi:hypothetical protein